MAQFRPYKEINQAELDRVRSDSYVRNLYLQVLVKSTLRSFDMVSEEEAKRLEAVAVPDGSDSLLPEIEDGKAKEVIIRFFDTLNMISDKELKKAMDRIRPDNLIPSVFEGVIHDTNSIQSLLLADRAGQESYRVFLAHKMGLPIDDLRVDKQIAKYLAFIYLYPDARDPLPTQICEMIDVGGDPNQPGRGYSWDKYKPGKVAKIIAPDDMYSGRNPRRIDLRTEKWSLASRFVKQFFFHFFFPSDLCFLPLIAHSVF